MNSRDLTTVVLVILAIFVLLPVLGMTLWGFGGMMGPGMMGRGPWTGFGPGMGGFGGGFGLLTLLLLIAGIVLLVLAFTRKEPKAAEEALAILKRRLASGEITKEQYEDLKQVLQ